MKPHARTPSPRMSANATARGQAMVEYVVVVAALAFALFVPIRDAASPDQPRTAVQILIRGFQQAYQDLSAALSIPE